MQLFYPLAGGIELGRVDPTRRTTPLRGSVGRHSSSYLRKSEKDGRVSSAVCAALRCWWISANWRLQSIYTAAVLLESQLQRNWHTCHHLQPDSLDSVTTSTKMTRQSAQIGPQQSNPRLSGDGRSDKVRTTGRWMRRWLVRIRERDGRDRIRIRLEWNYRGENRKKRRNFLGKNSLRDKYEQSVSCFRVTRTTVRIMDAEWLES